MKTSDYYDVIVIGAGPAGLSLAYYLEKSGTDYILLEKDGVGSSWKSMPEKLVVLSPWWTNLLPGSWLGFNNPFTLVSKDYYHNYLLRYNVINKLKVKTQVNIENLKKHNNSYTFKSSAGSFSSKFVICATGYYSKPFIPVLPGGNDSSIPEMHAAEYFSAEKISKDYPQVRRILLVGKRVTAGQLMVELENYGFEIDISCRSELVIRQSHTFKGKVKEFIYYFYEALKIRFKPYLKSNSFVEMDGKDTAKLLDNGIVGKKGNILGISDGSVSFSNGKNETAYDLVIYATGYSPALQYIDPSILSADKNGLPDVKNMESIVSVNLFFIGIDNLVNFRSRYLRGIAKDARRLNDIIQSRLT